MIIMISADTCRLIMKERPETLLAQLQQWSEQSDEVVISAITYAELVAAALLTADQAAHMALVQEFSDRLEDIVLWDRDAVDVYIRIQLQAMEAGHTLNMNDAMVAAHALSLEAKLLTQNRKQFDSIPGLEILDLPA